MSSAFCKQRVEKAQAQLKQQGADVLYIFSSTNMAYFAGAPMGPTDRVAAFIISRDAEPWFIVPSFEAGRIEKTEALGQFIPWEEHEDPFACIADTLRKNRLASATIALDGETWYWVLEGLRRTLPKATFING